MALGSHSLPPSLSFPLCPRWGWIQTLSRCYRQRGFWSKGFKSWLCQSLPTALWSSDFSSLSVVLKPHWWGWTKCPKSTGGLNPFPPKPSDPQTWYYRKELWMAMNRPRGQSGMVHLTTNMAWLKASWFFKRALKICKCSFLKDSKRDQSDRRYRSIQDPSTEAESSAQLKSKQCTCWSERDWFAIGLSHGSKIWESRHFLENQGQSWLPFPKAHRNPSPIQGGTDELCTSDSSPGPGTIPALGLDGGSKGRHVLAEGRHLLDCNLWLMLGLW